MRPNGTKLFPPMHIVAMRRDVYERDRWIAQSLFKAFVEAKKYCTIEGMFDGHLRYSLPFLHAAADEHKKIFGDTDPWAYGELRAVIVERAEKTQRRGAA